MHRLHPHHLSRTPPRSRAAVLAACLSVGVLGLAAAPAAAQRPLEERLSGSRQKTTMPSASTKTSPGALLEQERGRKGRGDGQGAVRLLEEQSSEFAVAGGRGRWSFLFEVGPEGIDPDGAIYFFVPRYWKWSVPQAIEPEAPGFTSVVVDDPKRGLVLSSDSKRRFLRISMAGRAMKPGETVRIHYGAGPAQAMADRFAEAASRFWFGVDGNGDGQPWLLPSIEVEVRAGPPARLSLLWPSTAEPGSTVRVTVAVLDALGNTGIPVTSEIRLRAEPALPGLPSSVRLEPEQLGRRTFEVTLGEAGVFRLHAETASGLKHESNPLLVGAETPISWADLQGHSAYSDGTGTPHDYFRYARDVAALDAVALTDHDHQGWPMAEAYLDRNPPQWQEILAEAESFHAPGRFVTVPGFEWTSWNHGHRHVLFFDGRPELLSSFDRKYNTPKKLWKALRGRDAITVAHHSAGGPIAVDWSSRPPPELEPVTEVLSIHGSSEAQDLSQAVYNPVSGNFVRDLLDRGLRFGLLGSGDGHDGHPGLNHLNSPKGGGLAAILTRDLTRRGILEALHARRVYATNGARIVLQVTLDGQTMGSDLCISGRGCPQARPAPHRLVAQVMGLRPLDRVELIQRGKVAETIPGEGRRELSFERELTELNPGGYLYLRALQVDGGLAISSPFFFD